MAKVKEVSSEEQFLEAAKNYATCAIGNIREMVEAMDHAGECDGTVECESCDGTGKQVCEECQGVAPENCESEDCTGGTRECITCKGEGTVPCTAGKDSDDHESWHDRDRARERIEEDALSVEVRGDWHTPGDEDGSAPTEYNILITTGGPAARITGNLDRGQPTSAVFEYQDWFKPWTEVYTGSADAEILLQYAQCFYFGE